MKTYLLSLPPNNFRSIGILSEAALFSFCDFVFIQHRLLDYRNQMALIQPYFDLGSFQNNHLENKQKCYQCYRWYTTIVYGHLGVRNRRRFDSCVKLEIMDYFPNQLEEERVGFCNV